MTEELIGIDKLAPMLGLKVATVKADVSRRPHVLPPRVIFPGSRRVLWLRSAVEKWVRERVAADPSLRRRAG